jgi:hypothetical protein
VRTSNAILDQGLRLTFNALTEDEMLSIRSHYTGQRGRFLSFAIPSNLLSGMSTPASFTPTGYSWTYAAPPQITDVGCRRYNVAVELATVPPEGANVNGAELTIGISFTTVPAMSETVTVSLAGGAASGT